MDFAQMRRHDGLVAAVVTFFATLRDDFLAGITFWQWGNIYEHAEPGSALEERAIAEMRKCRSMKRWQGRYQRLVTGPRLKAFAWNELTRISTTCEDWCWLFGRQSPATVDEDILYYRQAKAVARSSKDFREVLRRLISMLEVKYAADDAPDIESYPDYDDLLDDIRILQDRVVATAVTYDDWWHIRLGTNRWDRWHADAFKAMARLAANSAHFAHLYYETEDQWYWDEAVRRAQTFDDWISLFSKCTPKSKTLYIPAYRKARKLARRNFRDWNKIYMALPYPSPKEHQDVMTHILRLKLRRRDWEWLIHMRRDYPNVMRAVLEYMRKTYSFRQLWKHAWNKEEILTLMRGKGSFDDWRRLYMHAVRHSEPHDSWRMDTAFAEMYDAARTREQCRKAAKLFERDSDMRAAFLAKAEQLFG